MAEATVRQLVVYPVKSCKGISVPKAALSPLGFAWDRNWVVVDATSGRFITQRQIAKLCQVETQLPPEALAGAGAGSLPQDAALVVSAPGMEQQLRVPLRMPPLEEGALTPCTVWEYKGTGLDEGEGPAAWFSAYLGKPCRLVRYLGSAAAAAAAAPLPANATRVVADRYAKGVEVTFADGYPLLVATEESMDALNGEMAGGEAAAMRIDRFRANLIVAGAGPGWAEDGWVGLRTGNGVMIKFVKPCSRCGVPDIDQQTAVGGEEPTETMDRIRNGKGLGFAQYDKTFTHAVFFGVNAVASGSELVSVGDTLAVVPNLDSTPAWAASAGA